MNDKTINKKTSRFRKTGSLYFSPDSNYFALKEENQVQLWQKNGTYVGSLPGHTTTIHNVEFSPDSKIIATMGDDNFVYLYQDSGVLINTLRGHKSKVSSIKFSPNSEILASLNRDDIKDGSTINLWRRDGEFIASIKNKRTSEVYFNPKNRMIATINNDDESIELWNFEGKQLMVLPHNSTISSLSFSPDGELLVSASSDRKIRLWDTNGNLLEILPGGSSPIEEVIFNPVNGKMIISTNEDGSIQLWNRNGTKLKAIRSDSKRERKSQVQRRERSIVFSKDGNKIIIDDGFNEEEDEFEAEVWTINGDKVADFKDSEKMNVKEFTSRQIFNTDNFTWMRNDELRLYNLSGSILTSFTGHGKRISNAVFSPDGRMLASASDDNTVGLWSHDGRLLKKLDHAGKVNSVSFSADGKTLASASDDKTVRLWSYDGQLLKQLQHSGKVKIVKFSHVDNTLASSTNDKMLSLWTNTGELKSTFSHGSKVDEISFTLDGKTLVSNPQDDEIARLWQVSDGKEIIKRPENYSIYESPGNIKPSIPYGFQVAGIARSFKRSWRNLKISPDQTTFVTSGYRGVSVVDFDMDRLLIKACGLARNYLKNNSKVKEDDRKLCDDIPKQ
jgi:WD40 repeat protein